MKTQRSQTRLLSQFGQRYQHLLSILPPPKLKCTSQRVKNRSPLVFLLAIVSLTTTMGQRFYNVPQLYVGTKSPETIIAPQDASVEDQKTTKEQREAARKGAVSVLMINEIVTQQIYADIERSLRTAEELRVTAGNFPFVSTTALSISTQISVRKLSESDWETLLTILNSNQQKHLPVQFNSILKELYSNRQKSSHQKFTVLLQNIIEARQRYNQALALTFRDLKLNSTDENPTTIIPKPLLTQTNNPKSNLLSRQLNTDLLDIPDTIWQQTQTGINQAATNILTQGIPPGLPPHILQQAIKMQVSSLVPNDAQPLATQLLFNFLRSKSNLIKDKEQTQLQAEQAAQAVQPVILSVSRGEVIVYKGEVINQTSFVLLDKFGLSRRGISWLGFISFGGVISVTIVSFWLLQKRFYPQMRQRDYLVVLLLSLSTPILVNFGVNYTNLPLIGLLIGSFYSSPLGVTVVALLSGMLSISLESGKDYLLASAIGSLVGSLLAGKMRSREELAFLGGTIALTQGSVYFIISLILSGAGAVWYILLQEAALFSLSGLAWSIAALGLSPYLEHLFDLITPIRLAELSNPNRPLLKRLAAETPGTFQHTLFVATLAEAAARVLSCNVELVRAGTLYHDIGKMHDPLGFIENQMGGPNKHDQINDPWESAGIIKKHVSEGLVMARKYRLPKAVQAFIPEHQGTILIAYFHHQAQQIVAEQMEYATSNNLGITCVLKEEDFRYEGPVPQSRETGIVMLADASEAALRSLKEVSREQALSTINKILRARWQDNQLIDSGLKKEELAIIAEVFVEVWQQYNHQRIAYPKKL